MSEVQVSMKKYDMNERWSATFHSHLVEKFGASVAAELCTLLQTTGSVIAGGSVLYGILKKEPDLHWNINVNVDSNANKPQDIDIYTKVEHTTEVVNKICTLFGGDVKSTKYPSHYCNSFLRKNEIKKVFTISSTDPEKQGEYLFDIMPIRKKRSVVDVVTNFDLTICQVWFDGTFVYATHPLDIYMRRMRLQHYYIPAFQLNNKFILGRIDKYVQRGFTFCTDNIDSEIRYDILCNNTKQRITSLFGFINHLVSKEIDRLYRWNHPDTYHRFVSNTDDIDSEDEDFERKDVHEYSMEDKEKIKKLVMGTLRFRFIYYDYSFNDYYNVKSKNENWLDDLLNQSKVILDKILLGDTVIDIDAGDSVFQ